MKEIVKSRFFTLGIIPLALFLLWISLILFYNPYSPFSVLRYSQSGADKISGKQGILLAKDKVYGEFKSQDNYLGIVFFNFNIFNRTNSDTVVFRIKEKNKNNTNDWYAINKYKVDRFQNGFNYPFGFPPIENSKNKIYSFEIESLAGQNEDSIGINGVDSSTSFISSEYVFPRSSYFANDKELIGFIVKKYINFFINPVFYPILLLYIFPLFFYLILPFSKKKKYVCKYILFFPLFILILFDKFLVDEVVDLITFELQLFWIVLIIIYKWESNVTYLFALLFILMLPFLVFFGAIETAEKIAIQAYFFMVIATGELLIESKFCFKNPVSYKQFIKGITDIKLLNNI